MLMLFIFALNIIGQLNRTAQVTAAQAQVNKVLEDSGKHFREGMFALKEGNRSESNLSFDRAIEVFLMSTLNVQADQKLSSCYTNLIEAVYRIEFPSEKQMPKLRELSAQCGWNWNAADMKLADDVAALVKPAAMTVNNKATIVAAAPSIATQPNEKAVGFNSQEFEPSPLDELSKLEPTYEEQQVNDDPTEFRYSRPILNSSEIRQPADRSSSRIVKARAGDTVTKLAAREKADPVEVAKYNGLLPNSVIGAGREIRIPAAQSGGGSGRSVLRNIDSFEASLQRQDFSEICSGELDSPVIQQLKLGMTQSRVAAVLGKKLPLRSGSGIQQGLSSARLKNLLGVSALDISFYKGRLLEIHVTYDNSIKWRDLKEFREAISSSTNLPNAWSTTNLTDMSSFACPRTKFNLFVHNIWSYGSTERTYYLTLTDLEIFKQRLEDINVRQKAEQKRKADEARRKTLEQERRKEIFKP